MTTGCGTAIPLDLKISINNHYNAPVVEPWGERSQRGYGVEVIERFVRELAFVEHAGPGDQRDSRLQQVQNLSYNDLSADRQVVAAVAALEAILERQVAGQPDCVARINDPQGGLVLYHPGSAEPEVLYEPAV